MLQGKVAIVTGAGRGLGRAHALALAAAGAAVVVNDLGGAADGSGADAAPAEAVAAEIAAAGGTAIADAHDISSWREAGEVIHAALAAFGQLDIVINNAGISRFNPIDAETEEGWRRVLDVNLTGTAALTHWAGAHWRKLGPQPHRVIVNTSSPAGTNPLPGAPAYCASKAAVAALTITSALELAELGVRVNAIAPMARTRLTEALPMLDAVMAPVAQGFDRVAPEHVASVLLYLVSPACDFTGRIFGVEGDDVFLFDGFSAETHLNNAGRPWGVDTLAAALAGVDRQDRGFAIAPSARYPGPSPMDSTLAALRRII